MNATTKKPLYLVWVVVAILFAGCTHNLTLTISTHPEGAYLTEAGSGRAVGTAPMTVNYNLEQLSKHKDVNGCFLVNGFEARWVSSASTTSGNIRLCPNQSGAYTYSINRDPNFPGLDGDIQYAMQIQGSRVQQQRDNGVGGLVRGLADGLNSYNQGMQRNNQQNLYPPNYPKHCTSSVGIDRKSVNTDCY